MSLIKFLTSRREPPLHTASVPPGDPGEPWHVTQQKVNYTAPNGHKFIIDGDPTEGLVSISRQKEPEKISRYDSKYGDPYRGAFANIANITPEAARWLSDRLHEFAIAHNR